MILSYFLAVIIGIVLGLIGGGGSILAVPTLVYINKMDPKLSIALSLAIVGTTALVASMTHLKAKNINVKAALLFTPISMFGTLIGAKISIFMEGSTQLIIFAVIMFISSVFMLKDKKEVQNEERSINYFILIPQAAIVGVITGIVGVGGGFLIVPALVLIMGIPIKKAVGTSLLIIALNSLIGFGGYINQIVIPWRFLGLFIMLTTIGSFIGGSLIRFIPAEKLKKGFAVFLIIMSFVIIYKNKNKFQSLSSHFNIIIKVIA